MALFDVPGWSVPSTSPSKSSQKRKRPINDGDKIQTAEVNMEKLMHKLRGDKGGADGNSPRPSKRHKRLGNDDADKKQCSSHSRKDGGTTERREEKRSSTSMISRPKKMKAKKDNAKSVGQTAPSPSLIRTKGPASFTFQVTSSASAGLTSLQKNMKHSLDGARFRWVSYIFPVYLLIKICPDDSWINEALYKADSAKSHQMMQEDPKVYEEVCLLPLLLRPYANSLTQYHTGFRHQVQSWPTNPVSHYISALSTYPVNTIIADLGCGDAALARALVPNGMTVLSFDLVSDGVYVVEADICGILPLPGSECMEGEKSEGEGHVVDVVVCALSLMGTNWPNCIREAWRILKPGYVYL